MIRTGVKKLSATKRARAFNYTHVSLRSPTASNAGDSYKELHLRDFLVHLLHKLNDEVYQLMLQHLLGVKVCDQEGDIISLFPLSVAATSTCPTYLHLHLQAPAFSAK